MMATKEITNYDLLQEIRGVAKGQKSLIKRVGALEEGQQSLIKRMDGLEEGQHILIKRVDKLEKGQEGLLKGQEQLIKRVDGLEKGIKEAHAAILENREGIRRNSEDINLVRFIAQGANSNTSLMFGELHAVEQGQKDHEKRIQILEKQAQKSKNTV